MYFNVICYEACTCKYLSCVITFFETDVIFTYILFLYLYMYFNVICNEACQYLSCVITFFETDVIFTYILFLYLHLLQFDLL